jgi:drug/metabolite transporter (DMT)-like permease
VTTGTDAPDQAAANLKAIGLMVFAMITFSIDDAAIKFAGTLADGAPSAGEIIIIKGVVGTLVYGALMLREGGPRSLAHWRSLVLDPAISSRTLGDLVAAMAIITALTLMPLSALSAILQVQPLVVTLGAGLILKETVGWRRWSAILVGFIGVLIIIRPGAESFSMTTLWAILAVAGLAVRDLATRRIQTRFSTYSVITLVVVLLIPLGLAMHWLMDGSPLMQGIAWQGWALVLGGAVFGMSGYVAITASMRMGELSAVAPYRYTRLVAAMILGLFIFSEVPDTPMLLGAAMVIGAGLFTLYRERQVKVPPAAPL